MFEYYSEHFSFSANLQASLTGNAGFQLLQLRSAATFCFWGRLISFEPYISHLLRLLKVHSTVLSGSTPRAMEEVFLHSSQGGRTGKARSIVSFSWVLGCLKLGVAHYVSGCCAKVSAHVTQWEPSRELVGEEASTTLSLDLLEACASNLLIMVMPAQMSSQQCSHDWYKFIWDRMLTQENEWLLVASGFVNCSLYPTKNGPKIASYSCLACCL